MAENADVPIVDPETERAAFDAVAFAVTDGPTHSLRYANAAFQQLLSTGGVLIGRADATVQRRVDLTPLLDRAFLGAKPVRDELEVPDERTSRRWHCTVWPVSRGTSAPEGLVIEMRDASYLDAALVRQRSVAERLLLGAMREQDLALRERETARGALEASRRAEFLALASRDLSMSLDENTTREAVTRRVLPREGSWCIIDVVESNGAIHRLAVVHPDPAKQALARMLDGQWTPKPDDHIGAPSVMGAVGGDRRVVTHDSGAALIAAAHGPENLAILKKIGFGALLVVPLVVRGTLLGAITFVSRYGDPPFSPDEIALASDLAARCAMALDNARLYRESEALRAAADLANHAKSMFLGNMSHELLTPLNAIGGYTELLEMGLRGPVTAEQQADLKRIKRSQEHLLTMISEILTFVRSEAGRMEFHFAAVPVQSALDAVVDMLHGAIQERNLTLHQGSIDVDAVAWADPDRVRQILTNLVMNAVKYSKVEGGSITLSCTTTPDAVRIQVADTGPGIPAAKLEAIFEPFVQLASGLHDRRGGVGLGLAISRDLARAMNGELTAESAIGVGSRFTLALPRASRDS